MAAATLDLLIEQGATFTRGLTFRDGAGALINLTGYTLRGQIRESLPSTTIIASFTTTIANQTTNEGEASFSLTATETAGLPLSVTSTGQARKSSFYVYDLEAVKPDNTVDRILQGKVEVSPEVTR